MGTDEYENLKNIYAVLMNIQSFLRAVLCNSRWICLTLCKCYRARMRDFEEIKVLLNNQRPSILTFLWWRNGNFSTLSWFQATLLSLVITECYHRDEVCDVNIARSSPSSPSCAILPVCYNVPSSLITIDREWPHCRKPIVILQPCICYRTCTFIQNCFSQGAVLGLLLIVILMK